MGYVAFTSRPEVINETFDKATDVQGTAEDIGKKEEKTDAATKLWPERSTDHVCMMLLNFITANTKVKNKTFHEKNIAINRNSIRGITLAN